MSNSAPDLCRCGGEWIITRLTANKNLYACSQCSGRLEITATLVRKGKNGLNRYHTIVREITPSARAVTELDADTPEEIEMPCPVCSANLDLDRKEQIGPVVFFDCHCPDCGWDGHAQAQAVAT